MTETPISPLLQRLIEDMRMRKMDARSQGGYIRAIVRFAQFLTVSPDNAAHVQNTPKRIVQPGERRQNIEKGGILQIWSPRCLHNLEHSG